MASNDTLVVFTPLHNSPPGSNYATFSLRNYHPVLAFDDTTAEDAIFEGVLPRRYNGGGLTVRIIWMTTAVSGNIVFQASFERHQDGITDLDTDNFAAAQSTTVAVPGTSGVVTYTDIVFTDGAQIDSLAAGESFRFKVSRDAANASDTAVGDAQMLAIEIRES